MKLKDIISYINKNVVYEDDTFNIIFDNNLMDVYEIVIIPSEKRIIFSYQDIYEYTDSLTVGETIDGLSSYRDYEVVFLDGNDEVAHEKEVITNVNKGCLEIELYSQEYLDDQEHEEFIKEWLGGDSYVTNDFSVFIHDLLKERLEDFEIIPYISQIDGYRVLRDCYYVWNDETYADISTLLIEIEEENKTIHNYLLMKLDEYGKEDYRKKKRYSKELKELFEQEDLRIYATKPMYSDDKELMSLKIYVTHRTSDDKITSVDISPHVCYLLGLIHLDGLVVTDVGNVHSLLYALSLYLYNDGGVLIDKHLCIL